MPGRAGPLARNCFPAAGNANDTGSTAPAQRQLKAADLHHPLLHSSWPGAEGGWHDVPPAWTMLCLITVTASIRFTGKKR